MTIIIINVTMKYLTQKQLKTFESNFKVYK